MMIEGEWQVGPDYISHFQPELNYGVAPFPPPADHPEQANTAVVQGAVAVIPAGVKDLEAAAGLLAWMMLPEILAEETYANANLPTSRAAARDPRFQQIPKFEVFMNLTAHPNAKYVVTTPISLELNQALGQVEEELLRIGPSFEPTPARGIRPGRLLPPPQGPLAGSTLPVQPHNGTYIRTFAFAIHSHLLDV